MRGKVSVIIPVYNTSEFIADCLESVINQEYQNFEVIVINDGSTDNSEEIIKKYVENDERFRFYSQTNCGLGFTRNKGISLSRGDYLFFLDADDIIPKQALSKLVDKLKRNDADYSVGKVVRFNKVRKYIPVRHIEFDLYNDNQVTNIWESTELLQDSIACNKLWRTGFVLKNNLFFKENSLYEDLSFTTKAAVLANKIAVVKNIVYYWRVRDNEENPSITQQQMSLNNTANRLNVLLENRNWLITSNVKNEVVEQHDLKILLDVIRLHVLKYCLVDESEKKEWSLKIKNILMKIPTSIAYKLPNKERTIYDMFVSENFTDLLLFSETLLNKEKSRNVIQLKNKFILKGEKEYNVTKFLKPLISVEKVKKRAIGLRWGIFGKVYIPKASHKTEGEVYVINRKSKERICLGTITLNDVISKNLVYPYERFSFNMVLDLNFIKKMEVDSVLDFYFCLKNYPDSPSSRIKIETNPEKNNSHRKVYLYKTRYGNLSVKKKNLF